MQITLSFPPNGTSIPYFDADKCDPEQRHEYVDLRLHPARIDELPELRHAPKLKDFLLAINGQDTIFRTFGCNVELSSAETEAAGPAVVHSYIHVGFADVERCRDQDYFYRLCGRLGKHLYGQAALQSDDELEVELAVAPLWVDGKERGYVLTIACSVLAWSDNEARQLWVRLMELIATFLTTEKLANVDDALPTSRLTAAEHEEVIRAARQNASAIWTNLDDSEKAI